MEDRWKEILHSSLCKICLFYIDHEAESFEPAAWKSSVIQSLLVTNYASYFHILYLHNYITAWASLHDQTKWIRPCSFVWNFTCQDFWYIYNLEIHLKYNLCSNQCLRLSLLHLHVTIFIIILHAVWQRKMLVHIKHFSVSISVQLLRKKYALK